jgi:hypothetical protein
MVTLLVPFLTCQTANVFYFQNHRPLGYCTVQDDKFLSTFRRNSLPAHVTNYKLILFTSKS